MGSIGDCLTTASPSASSDRRNSSCSTNIAGIPEMALLRWTQMGHGVGSAGDGLDGQTTPLGSILGRTNRLYSALATSRRVARQLNATVPARLLTDEPDFWENPFVCPARHRHPRTALRVGPNRRRSSALMRTASPRPVGSSEALSDRAGASQVRARSVEGRKAPQNDDNQRQGSALGRSNIQPCDQVSRDRRTRPRRDPMVSNICS
jgi:hypothetical protein